jgi:hypothetical protein
MKNNETNKKTNPAPASETACNLFAHLPHTCNCVKVNWAHGY